MVTAGVIVLDYGFGWFLQSLRRGKHVRGGLTSQQESGLGATMKKGRSGQGQENIPQAPV